MFPGGAADGNVYIMNVDIGDDVSSPDDIEFEIATGEWNPFKASGQKARFGYCDFLCEPEVNANAEQVVLSVDFFVDDNATKYATKTLTFPSTQGIKEWIRVPCGTIGDFHKMKIYHTQQMELVLMF